MKEFNISSIEDFDRAEREASQEKKELFISLVARAGAVVVALLLLILILPVIGLKVIHPWAPFIFPLVIGILLLLVIWATFGLVIGIRFGHSFLIFGKTRGMTIKLFLPLMMLVGRMTGISKERIRASFVKVNNDLVSGMAKRYKPCELLLLMPHCLQNSRCSMRLTYSIDNCKRCGECPIDRLLALSEKYGIHLAIATGGTIARRIVVKRRPKMILAVACERDLASGIQDTYPLPVFGVLNLRPHGPCLDTNLSLRALENAIRQFMEPSYFPENRENEVRKHTEVNENVPPSYAVDISR